MPLVFQNIDLTPPSPPLPPTKAGGTHSPGGGGGVVNILEDESNYLCTYDLYGPVRNCFDAGRYFMWEGGGREVGAGNREFLGPLK